jgi:2-keto-4-pentenoate hydratase
LVIVWNLLISSDNGCHGALVLGNELTDSGGGTFDELLDNLYRHTCTLEVNGHTAANGKGDKVLGHPLNALCWLANSLAKRGEMLKKGDVISTGVCIDKLILLKKGDSVNVDYGSLGSVNFSVHNNGK